jgi:multidrug efflux pump
MFQITGVPTTNAGIGGMLFKSWDKRSRSAHEIQQELQPSWNKIAGGRVAAFQFPPLPGSSGLPVQFVITTTEPFENLNTVAQQCWTRREGQQVLLRRRRPENRHAAGTRGGGPRQAGHAGPDAAGLRQRHGAALGGGYVNYFSIAGRSYKVIPQVQQVDRLNPDECWTSTSRRRAAT